MSATALKRTSLPLLSCEQIKYNFFWFISFKHLLGYVLQNRSLQKFWKTYKKTPLPEFLSDKAVHHQACNFIKKRLYLRCFTMNFAKLFSAPFLQNSSGECFSFQFNLLNSQPVKDIYLYFPRITWFQIFLSHFLFLVEARNQSI